MFRTSKKFRFSAAHALDHLESGRQCARMHGHDYTVEVIMQSDTLSIDSFVRDPLDYRRIEKFIRYTLDRRNLNEVFPAEFEPDMRAAVAGKMMPEDVDRAVEDMLATTNENIALALFLRFRADFPEMIAVRVHSDDAWAEYRDSSQ